MIYCYRTKSGELIEQNFPIGAAPRVIVVGGKKAERSFADERKSFGMGTKHEGRPSGTWPMTCMASGVHPEQAGQLREFLAKSGVPTEVTSGGDPIYTSARHRRKALKVRGMIDKGKH